MPSFTVKTALGDKDLEGEQIAESKTTNFPRWIEFRLWKLDDGTYASYRVGRSAVYHTADTTCMKKVGQAGEPATVDDLPDEAVACEICKPPAPRYLAGEADRGNQIEVRLETDRITLDFFPTAQEVTNQLVTNRGRIVVSAPVADLLSQARRNDVAFLGVELPAAG